MKHILNYHWGNGEINGRPFMLSLFSGSQQSSPREVGAYLFIFTDVSAPPNVLAICYVENERGEFHWDFHHSTQILDEVLLWAAAKFIDDKYDDESFWPDQGYKDPTAAK